jgi:glutamate-1-semialdehyde 2,1-aminomutase
MKIVAIIQARMGSARLPNKVMKPICGVPLIELLIARLSTSKRIDQIVVATSTDIRNQPLAEHIRKIGYEVFRGSEDDVLDRYYQAAKCYQADVVVRITGDCPLIDAALVDKVVNAYEQQRVDFMTNTRPPTFPDGLDTAVFSFATLEIAHKKAKSKFEREHVVPFIRESGQFTIGNLANSVDQSSERWTVDEYQDFEVVDNVFKHFYPRLDFSWQEVMRLRKEQPDLFQANKHFTRNEGAVMNSGQKLWRRAKQIIPGGNMLLSKRAEMFLPEQWPAYFSRAKGCRVWDLDDNEYIDMSIMGIGTNTLGYGHPDVDKAVHKTIEAGNMSTLNCPEEVQLAERLIDLHPWAEMVRFARSGGEANAIAIRIARAASGRDKVAICGYHGWHDWYLAANLGDDQNLAGHLLPGLEPRGVPQNLYGTVFPFRYNHLDELEELVAQHPDLGVIKMEVQRNELPKDGFLEKVRKLATDNGIVLIFDECTSGFRETFGGLHKKFGVEPDMALFGKALGNGYAITATIGRRSVMEAAQSTFISSTFWTERIGPSAALATLQSMERQKSWEIISQTGNKIGQLWKDLAGKYDLSLRVFGLPALIKFSFDGPNALAYKTLITQEMLGKGYLAGNCVYVCTEHTPEVIAGYGDALDAVFKVISDCETGKNVMSLLKGPLCHTEFKRLN